MAHFLNTFIQNIDKTIDNALSIKKNPSSINHMDDITEELYLFAIKQNPHIISKGNKTLSSKFNTHQFYIKLITENYHNLGFIEDQTYDMCLAAIKLNYQAIKYVKNQTLDICKEAIKISECAYFYIRDKTIDINLAVVKKAGYMLKHISDQTPSICLEAVKQDGLALEYVDNRFNLYYMAEIAILQNPYALEFVKHQTKELCELAISLDPECIQFVKLQRKYQYNKLDGKLDGKLEVEDSEYECNICMNTDTEEYSKTICNHVFHTKCIEKWLDIKNNCPCCREKFDLDFVI